MKHNLRHKYIAEFEERIEDLHTYFSEAITPQEKKQIRDEQSFSIVLQKAMARSPTLKYMLEIEPEIRYVLWNSADIQEAKQRNLRDKRSYTITMQERLNVEAQTKNVREKIRQNKQEEKQNGNE